MLHTTVISMCIFLEHKSTLESNLQYNLCDMLQNTVISMCIYLEHKSSLESNLQYNLCDMLHTTVISMCFFLEHKSMLESNLKYNLLTYCFSSFCRFLHSIWVLNLLPRCSEYHLNTFHHQYLHTLQIHFPHSYRPWLPFSWFDNVYLFNLECLLKNYIYIP